MRSRLLWEDLHGGDRRLLWQPVRQRRQVPSPRGGKIPVSVILLTIPPRLIPIISVVIKCVNGGTTVCQEWGRLVRVSAKCHFPGIGIPSQPTPPYNDALLYSLILSRVLFFPPHSSFPLLSVETVM